MNNKRRKRLDGVVSMLETASNLLEQILDEETDCLNNMPENLESSNRYCKIEEAIDNMDTALESVEQAIEYISAASG